MKHYYLRAEKYKHTTKAFVLPDGTWTKRQFKKGKEHFVVFRLGKRDFGVVEELSNYWANAICETVNGGENG